MSFLFCGQILAIPSDNPYSFVQAMALKLVWNLSSEQIMRSTDAKPVSCFRTSRYFCISGEWYFSTRENKDFGPYVNREHAEMALSRYLETQSIIHYLRGVDPALESGQEPAEQLVASYLRCCSKVRAMKGKMPTRVSLLLQMLHWRWSQLYDCAESVTTN